MSARVGGLCAVAGVALVLLAGCQTTSESPPTGEELADLVYAGIYPEPVRLQNGLYEGKPYVTGGASRPRVELVRSLQVSGDLDGEGTRETAVFLIESAGGSGTRTWLAVVANRNGRPVNVATRLIGDRVQIMSLRFDKGSLELEMIAADEQEPACCGTRKYKKRYRFDGAQLEETESRKLEPVSLQDIAGHNWRLLRLPDGTPVPKGITINAVFQEGRISGNSSCNRYFASIESSEAQNIAIGNIGSTRMACQEPRMRIESRYLQALQNVRAFRFRFGDLVLIWQGDTGQHTMRFSGEPLESRSVPDSSR